MSKIDNNLRNAWANFIENFIKDENYEVMHEKDNILWIPVLDENNEDKWIKINIQVPVKAGADEGYELDTFYHQNKAEKERKAKEKAEAKAKKIASDKAKREKKA